MSTIRNADKIVVMGTGGEILEQGTYEELSAAKGAFHELVESQDMAQSNTPTLFDFDEKTINQPETTAKAIALNNVRTASSNDHPAENGIPATPRQKSKRPASLWTLIKFTASMNRQEWKIMLLGIITSIIAGAGEPVQCVILAKSISTLSLPPSQYQKLRSDTNFWSAMFVMIAVVMLACSTVLGLSFAYGSERLVRRSRDRAFRSILRQDIQFFDRPENTVGALTSFLSTETTHLAGKTFFVSIRIAYGELTDPQECPV